MIAQAPAGLAQLPTVLALLGTVLMALAIFAPPSAAAAGPTVSFAPPLVPRPLERDTPTQFWARTDSFESQSDPFAEPLPSEPGNDERIDVAPAWPELVDPRAVGCDAAARLALVDALIAVRAPWADALLRRAAAEERDPDVSAALAEASYFAGIP